MRSMTFLLLMLLNVPGRAATSVTVAQLQEFLNSDRVAKESDEAIAYRLNSITLSEQLADRRLDRILTQTRLGPRTIEQLRLLAASSVFYAPPAAELPSTAIPDSATQHRLISSAVDYVNGYLRQLPDFLAIRVTSSYDNFPEVSAKRNAKPEARMRFVREFRRELAYRNGREIDELLPNGSRAKSKRALSSPGLSTSGEFGPALLFILGDSFRESVVWSRWQKSETDTDVAVFRYEVPRGASDYLIDFCCYEKSIDDPPTIRFHEKPGYHGEVYIDPASGAIIRMTLEAELNESDPMTDAGIAVDYGRVDIGGKEYICPVRGVASSTVHNLLMETVDKVGPERTVNLVSFQSYRKFGSISRVVTSGSDASPN
jgi:hypothetical protein